MLTSKTPLLCLLLCFAIACNDTDEAEENTTATAPAAPAAPASPATNAAPAAATATLPAQPPAATSKAVGVNPPHGQPGHRCDIPEGAPLNSAPSTAIKAPPPPLPMSASQAAAAAPAPQAPVQPVQAAPAVSPSNAAVPVTAAGKNPPHGQPGHRCDIAVGAPLNSKPAAPAAPQVVTSPAAPSAPAASGTASGKKNPPHGQPGHRCDIAVGAPLDSKPGG